jgi:hypothetical protein
MGVRVLVVPFIQTDGQRDDVRRGAWIGIDVGLGEVRYVDGVYEGSFVRVGCCRDHSAHWTRRGTLRKRPSHPMVSLEVRVRDCERPDQRFEPPSRNSRIT